MTTINIAASGYTICAVAFSFLAVILMANWRGHSHSALLIIACITTVVWSVLNAYQAYNPDSIEYYVQTVELIRNACWISFLLYLLKLRGAEPVPDKTLVWMQLLSIAILLTGLSLIVGAAWNFELQVFQYPMFRFLVIVVLEVISLVLIEQLFRNTPLDQRWSIKFFCIGVGGIFSYDFYMYSDALLMNGINDGLWGGRGYVNAMVMPLIAISASRNPQWSLRLHVSKRFVFHSAAIVGSGVYLIAMGVGGYYIKLYSGSWGGIAQIIFLAGALFLLLLLLFSGDVRAKVKVFLSKNFFSYKYDYRDEWLKLIQTMAMEQNDYQIRTKAIMVIADIVESPAGILCLKDNDGNFRNSVNLNMTEADILEAPNSSLIDFLNNKQWVINLDEYHSVPELYGNLELPRWLGLLPQAWIIIPFMHKNELIAFAVLARSRARININWEDRDLLFTAARQISSYLVLLQATEELMDAKQFEAFNRLSAYVVHDLKNLVAQLSLVVSNAERHKNNPEFMQDAIETVKSATEKMQKLLTGLRKDRLVGGTTTGIDLIEVVKEVIDRRKSYSPVPTLECKDKKIEMTTNRDRLLAVIEHLVENAQQATQAAGWVKVSLSRQENGTIVMEIADNGCGMDQTFLKERLFKPFQTTKGNAGMGIGVYEAREHFRSMGGTMNVFSEIDEGTRFTIEFPNAKDTKYND